jgi:hypothetical protein
MIIMGIISLLLSSIIGVLSYVVYNLSRKIDIYEAAIQEFYERTSITLHTMRTIDERQLFEKDDDVGSTFQMLVDTLGELRPLIYGVTDDTEEN